MHLSYGVCFFLEIECGDIWRGELGLGNCVFVLNLLLRDLVDVGWMCAWDFIVFGLEVKRDFHCLRITGLFIVWVQWGKCIFTFGYG